mgnify:CR=1 FL=1
MFGSEKHRQWLPHPGMNGGGGGGGKSKTTSEVPAELKPLATRYAQEGIDVMDTPFQYYNDQRYADLTAPQMQGIDMATNRALQGSATMDAAEGNLNQMMAGGPNPYLDAMFNQASGQVQNRIDSNAALAGRLGSNSHAETYQNGMNNLAAQMYGGAYESDQARRMQAIGMAPTFGDAAYKDAAQLMSAGQTLQDQQQNNLDFGYQQFMGEQNKPYQDMAAAAGIFQSQPFGSSSTTSQSGGGK